MAISLEFPLNAAMNPLCSEESQSRIHPICQVLPVKRHRELLRLLHIRDQMTVREIAGHFEVSVDTARRDLDLLASRGLLNRTYGGAVAIQKSERQKVDDPQQIEHLAQERRLARFLNHLIQDGETLLLNGGSATKCCAEVLGNRNLRIVTNNLDIAFHCVTLAQVYVLGKMSARCASDGGPNACFGLEHHWRLDGLSELTESR
jgi:DeoR/GlpR family transcriptional regulator of sugar metabolism